jgi:hypothetical protein
MDIQRILSLDDPTCCEVVYHVLKDEEYVEEILTVQGTLEQLLESFEPHDVFVVFTFPTGLKVALKKHRVERVLDSGGVGNCEIVFLGDVDGTHQELKYEVLGTFDQIMKSLTEEL